MHSRIPIAAPARGLGVASRLAAPFVFAAFATFVAFVAFVAFTAISGCGSSGDAPPADASTNPPSGDGTLPASCDLEAPTACPEPAPTYGDVSPIFASRCVTCHSGAPGGPWALRDYEHVVDWSDTIHDELLACAMPPLDAGVPITKEERLAILTWIRCGTPP